MLVGGMGRISPYGPLSENPSASLRRSVGSDRRLQYMKRGGDANPYPIDTVFSGAYRAIDS